ncbi:MAG: efflux RND transporter permease subunit [Victivallaceae bacterium]|nr:efflux RND transporter permease subunit [Victivallaceae bacterium]
MFSQIFIQRPKLAFVISLVMVLLGVICLRQIPIAEYPEIAPPQIFVRTFYVGASCEVVADTVGFPIESEINGVEDMLYFTSTSDNSGMYSCTITFKSGTNSDIAMVNVQNAVRRAEPSLPSEVLAYGIQVGKRSTDMLAVVNFITDFSEMSVLQLCNYVTAEVRDPIARIDGISDADIMATQEYAMRVWLDPVRMAALKVSYNEVVDAIKKQNLMGAVGSIGSEGSSNFMEFKLNVQGRLKSPEEFNNIVVRSNGDGTIIRLSDIARCDLGSKNYYGHAFLNGVEGVGMAIYRSDDANALDTIRRVRTTLDDLAKRFPKGVSYDITYDPTEFITISIHEIVETLIVALLLVVLITYLFLQDWRATLVPTLAIPVSLLATFPFMLAMNFSINVLTMFGLILVIGSLVDDAIVVVENTQSLMEREGLSAKEAASKSMKQITGAIIATTLVTVACYLPLAFYGGMVGNIYIQFAFTMCISLCLSTFVAMTLSPAVCSLIMRPPSKTKPKIFAPFNKGMDFSRKIYLSVVKLLVRRSLLTLLIFVVVLFLNYLIYNRLPGSFLPQEDKACVMCNIELAPGATQARTLQTVREFESQLIGMHGIESVMTVAGYSMLNGLAENAAMAIIHLDKWDLRTTADMQIGAMLSKIQRIGNTLPAARVIAFTPPAIMGLGATGGATFMLTGSGEVDPVDLSNETKKMIGTLFQNPKVMYANSNYNADNPQLFLDIDREKAETLGVPISNIYTSLQSKLASLYINDFNILGYAFDVNIQSTADEREKPEDILSIMVNNNQGDMVPLSSLATLRYTVGPKQIKRFNRQTCAEINAQANPGITSSELMNVIESVKTKDQYRVEWTGISYQERANEGRILFLLAMALVFAYLFLVAQYESWTMPFSVMLSVAFASLGALLGLYFWKNGSLSIYAQLGLVMLIGLAAKNAILMVEFSKQERERGLPIEEAAVNGADLRYRAVLMTAWSFLFGVFPLVIASGAGAGSRQAIGVTTFYGMLLATVVGIIFIPALYSMVEKMRTATAKLTHRKK